MSSNALKWLLILDFEANCGDNIRPSKKNQEVIEWPTLLYNFEADILEDTFHEYIKPVVLPEITPFCTELTGIEQSTVEKADSFEPVFNHFQEFLKRYELYDPTSDTGSYAFVTCGEWDLKTMLPAQLAITFPNEDQADKIAPFQRYLNIKKAFASHYGRPRPLGMAPMLQTLGLKLEGRHHSGVDDCQNILRIVQRMRKDGWKPEI